MGQCVIDGVLDGGALLSVLIGNFDAEFVFQCHDQLHGVQGVCTQIGHKGFFAGDLLLFHAKLFGNDFFDACFDIAHMSLKGL